MQTLLWAGDAACGSGFGRATHYILKEINKRFNLSVLGVNYKGDPHDEPYKIYPAWAGGDVLGIGRLDELIPKIKPDVVVLQANPWNIVGYQSKLPTTVPCVGIIAVEGKNCKGTDLNKLKHAIFWTKFGEAEALQGGMTVPSSVVPLGVDLDIYQPGDRVDARQAMGLPEACWDAFILGNINRNQNRKRLDLTIQYFARWYHQAGRPNAYLYLHVLPGSSTRCDCEQLAGYYGIADRLILSVPKDTFLGMTEANVVKTYQSFDVQITTTLGEGWGLTTMEGMACGIPQIAPRYAALAEWAADGALMVPCFAEGLMPDVRTMIGGVPDADITIKAIDTLFQNPRACELLREKGLAVVQRPEYRWDAIATRFADDIEAAVG